MIAKKLSRLRRAKKTRANITNLQSRDADIVRMSVHRTPRHIYVQLFAYDALARQTKVLVTASSVEADVRGKMKNTGNIETAKAVGKLIAQRAKAANIGKVAFDRSGFKYHGRVKALADAAREDGLDF